MQKQPSRPPSKIRWHDPKRIERYLILERLCNGGMSFVYKAQDEATGREVALKLMKPTRDHFHQCAGMARTEAEILSRLDMPGIVPLIDSGKYMGLPFIAMEMMQGRTLFQARRAGELSQPMLLAAFCRICSIMAQVHQRGIVHRDLKPNNFFLRGEPEDLDIVIFDFGLSKAEGLPDYARRGTIIGTYEYISPEQIDLPEHVDSRADIYSCGVSMYHMLAGKLPFSSEARSSRLRLAETIRMHKQGQPFLLSLLVPGIEVELCMIVEKAMKKSRLFRYQSFDELKADLEKYLRRKGILVRADSLPETGSLES